MGDCMNEIKIDTDIIKLDQFLKFSGIVNTGGHAKALIKDGLVYVNEQLCTQRGKSLTKGDVIEVVIEENLDEDTYQSIDFVII